MYKSPLRPGRPSRVPKLISTSRYQYHGPYPSQLNVLLQLSIALLANLGRNKACPARENQDAELNEMKHPELGVLFPGPVPSGGYRAVLGCFYLSSCV
jgi:hypothetical protein